MESDATIPEPMLELSGTALFESPSSEHPPSDNIPASPTDDHPSQSVSSVLDNVFNVFHLPSPWMTISADPVVLCKMKVHPCKQVEVDLTIRINDDMKWTLFVSSCELNSSICPLLGNLPIHLENMESNFM